MSFKKNILVIIPARGGSKGIPRKNLRPLHGKPLIYYAINTALNSTFHPDIYVSTDDDEIAFFSQKFGVKIHRRGPELSSDHITLDPVVIDAYHYAVKTEKKDYEAVITMQPTSPLLTSTSLDNAISKLLGSENIDTILSAVHDSHLTWKLDGETFMPNYAKRVNRQQLPKIFKETGGFLLSKPETLRKDTRIGEQVSLYELNAEEGIDIDDFNDWALCDYYLGRKHLVFVVSGNETIGLGHVYNCLSIANEILQHKITFLVDRHSQLAYAKILEHNYKVHIQQAENIVDDIVKLQPDVVINDCLDTTAEYIGKLNERNYKVVNIEDLGEGAQAADLVINAIYPEQGKKENHFFGASYFCVRDEFFFHPEKIIREKVKSVLISFGGVDPCNLTAKVLQAIYSYCLDKDIAITVITGLGYKNYQSLERFSEIKLVKNVKNISDYFFDTDLAFSSAGRTVYELSILGTPTIVLAQNERELTHFYASESYGFINLGLGNQASAQAILKEFSEYAANYKRRKEMSARMLQEDVANGKKRVVKLINELIKK